MLPARRTRLAKLLEAPAPFYREKWAGLDVSVDNFARLPPTTKAELLTEQAQYPPYGRLLQRPRSDYRRLHQTSGTHGQPLRWLDTAESWSWMLDCWEKIFQIVGLTAEDRLFFPFSFGPFLGFWTAFESACRRGNLCLAAGGLSTPARLKMMIDNEATVILTTPTYALHLGEAALAGASGSRVRAIIVAGEPGGSIGATRARIEELWKARVFDHSGMTEIGPMTIECPEAPGGLHVLEDDYLAEVVDPATFEPATAGTNGELVVTNLGRTGSPLFRYRTGDLVRVDPDPCPCGRGFMRLAGGILGRTDDMIAIRGNNVYPSAIEGVLRKFQDIVEYRIEIDATSPLTELRIEVEPTKEPAGDLAERVAQAIRDELLFRAEVRIAPVGSLPRFEMKARRIHKKV